MKKKKLSVKFFSSLPIVRWWIVGLFFAGLNIPMLYLLVDMLRLPLIVASLIAAEISTILRFFLNDRWVFSYATPTWKRFWQYHLAVTSSFLIWWSVTNILPHWGIHYLLGSIIATACSVGWSIMTNFFWIWRSGRKT